MAVVLVMTTPLPIVLLPAQISRSCAPGIVFVHLLQRGYCCRLWTGTSRVARVYPFHWKNHSGCSTVDVELYKSRPPSFRGIYCRDRTSSTRSMTDYRIRSFDNARPETIQFHTPLTLIVGSNGSGKTVRAVR